MPSSFDFGSRHPRFTSVLHPPPPLSLSSTRTYTHSLGHVSMRDARCFAAACAGYRRESARACEKLLRGSFVAGSLERSDPCAWEEERRVVYASGDPSLLALMDPSVGTPYSLAPSTAFFPPALNCLGPSRPTDWRAAGLGARLYAAEGLGEECATVFGEAFSLDHLDSLPDCPPPSYSPWLRSCFSLSLPSLLSFRSRLG